MRTITRQKKRKKSGLFSWLIWVMLTASFGLMGLSLASFQDSVEVANNTIGTANIDVQFTGCFHNKSESTFFDRNSDDALFEDEADVSTPGNEVSKSITVTIKNAHPGEEFVFDFYVQSQGSIPVKIEEIEIKDECPAFYFTSSFPKSFIDDQEPVKGQFTIGVYDNIDGPASCSSFIIDLHFEQGDFY